MEKYYHGTTVKAARTILREGLNPSEFPNVTKSEKFATSWGRIVLRINVPEGYVMPTWDEGEFLVSKRIPPKYINISK